MSDEIPVPVTLEMLAEQIGDFRTSVDRRFDELKAQLRAEIEAVRDDVKLVYDVVIARNARNEACDKDLERFKTRLNDHDLRLLALEEKDRRA